MKEFKGTPGSWHVGTRSGHNANMVYSYDHQEEYGDSAIASVYMVPCNRRVDEADNGEGVANARLIAAAPDLLEALQEIESWDWEQLRAMPDHVDWKDALEAVDLARHAIAKALGEDHG